MSEKLELIRKKIDAMDNKIHDLIIQRAELISEVAEEKRKTGAQIVHPAREAAVIRRLLKRHKGDFPVAAILNIWRELVGAVCMMQKPLNIIVTESERIQEHWDMAKIYFGRVLPMNKTPSAPAAVGAVRDDKASFAVLPWPEDALDNRVAERPWWSYLYNTEQKIYIIAALPFGYNEEQDQNGFMSADPKAVVISKTKFQKSGEDHSCLVLRVDPSVSRARIVDEMEKLDIKLLSLHTQSSRNPPDEPSLHLLIVEGYIAEDDAQLEKINRIFEADMGQCVSVGGYPVPPKLNAHKSHV